MGMVQVLHYYCKRRRAELLNDITFKKGISCQIQTDFLDISDIVKELTNKNHIDCVAIDEDLFGIGDIEDIISKLEVLKFVTDETKILIIALDRMRNDEMIQGIQKSGVVDYIITKEMIDDFDDVLLVVFDSEIAGLSVDCFTVLFLLPLLSSSAIFVAVGTTVSVTLTLLSVVLSLFLFMWLYP